MLELLKIRSQAFNERFNTLKAQYDELSDKRSDILQSVEQKTKQLKAQTEEYQNAMKEYKKAESERIDAEFDIYLALNKPNSLIYSPQCDQQQKLTSTYKSHSKIYQECVPNYTETIIQFLIIFFQIPYCKKYTKK